MGRLSGEKGEDRMDKGPNMGTGYFSWVSAGSMMLPCLEITSVNTV